MFIHRSNQLTWCLCLLFLPISLGCGGGEQEAPCTRAIGNTTIATHQRQCNYDCECNNQSHSGACIAGTCNSRPRTACPLQGEKRSCELPSYALVGSCKTGVQICQDEGLNSRVWGDCKPFEVKPSESTQDLCSDGLDNDCDGKVDGKDPDCKTFCNPGDTRQCYTGPNSTGNKGICREGKETCNDSGEWSGVCDGEVKPKEETCNNLDDNCDGTVDEGLQNCQTTACTPGEIRPCFTGQGCTRQPDGTYQCKGNCKSGTRTCTPQGVFEDACKGEVKAIPEICNNQDDNCDGNIDENVTQECYSGAQGCALKPDKTYSCQGTCKAGTQTCRLGAWQACIGESLPEAETCDGKDTDCDGKTDEASDGSPLTQTCYTGPKPTQNTGACRNGTQSCSNGSYGACTGEQKPTTETCDGKDNDCDGQIDEDLKSCKYCPTPKQTRTCYSGPTGTVNVGVCAMGSQTCSNQNEWSACLGEVVPKAELCNDKDDDCDGQTDEGLSNCGRRCSQPGQTRACYTGPTATRNQGRCKDGQETCEPNNKWGDCKSQVLPAKQELCNGVDDDCDGSTDEGFPNCNFCSRGQTQNCYTAPSPTLNVGECKQGIKVCIAKDNWGSCQGEVVPKAELCNNKDDDCDGTIDENLKRSCYTGVNTKGCTGTPGGTYQCVGDCGAGQQTCSKGQWSVCSGSRTPKAELCDKRDNDCDGTIDEGNICSQPCQPNQTRPCYTGPLGTIGVGTCKQGVQVCGGNARWSDCQGDVVPQFPDVCDKKDNNCNGQIDEGTTEICGNKTDDDCDGQIDESCNSCSAAQLQTQWLGLGFHVGAIQVVRYSPNGSYMASGGEDQVVKLWDAKTGLLLRSFIGHSKGIQDLDFNPTNTQLATSSTDRTVKIWDIQTGKLIRTLSGHSSGVYGVRFHPKNNTLLSSSTDGSIRVWNLTSGATTQTLRPGVAGVRRLDVSSDGKMVAVIAGNNTYLFELSSGKVLFTLSGHTSTVTDVSFHTNTTVVASSSSDKTIKLWNTTTGKLIRTLSGHASGVNSIAFRANSDQLASGSSDRTVRTWNTSTGATLRTFSGHTLPVGTVAFRLDGAYVLSGSNGSSVREWDVQQGKLRRSITAYLRGQKSVTYHPNGKTLAYASELKDILLWDTLTGAVKSTLKGHTNAVWSIAYSPDGKSLASFGHFAEMIVWDVATLQKRFSVKSNWPSVQSVNFSPDSQHLAYTANGTEVHIVDAYTGKLKLSLKGHPKIPNVVQYNPVGRTIATGASDNHIRIWSTFSGSLLATLKGHTAKISKLSYSPDGKTLASVAEDKSVKLWSTATGKLLRTLKQSGATGGLAFSPDGAILAVGAQGTEMYNTSNWTLLRTLPSGYNIDLAFHPSGTSLAVLNTKIEALSIWRCK